jgi:hypothetical protein
MMKTLLLTKKELQHMSIFSIDCFKQCTFDAIGDCAKSDVFLDKIMNHDPEKMKVYLKIACADVSCKFVCISLFVFNSDALFVIPCRTVSN